MKNFSRIVLGMAALFAALLAGQSGGPATPEPGARLTLEPSERLTVPQFPALKNAKKMPMDTARGTIGKGEIRPAILNLKPAGDPIYLVEESGSDDDQWTTYRRPKVEPFSRDGEGIALQGYDLVAYLDRRAEKGREEFPFEYGGVTWLFSSRDNRELFRKDPERYLPEYGGFCAYSVGNGYPVTADPRVFAMDGGKLYLFFDKAVRAVWEQDQIRLIHRADQNWPRLHL